jgi:hypothetical protein
MKCTPVLLLHRVHRDGGQCNFGRPARRQTVQRRLNTPLDGCVIPARVVPAGLSIHFSRRIVEIERLPIGTGKNDRLRL